MKPPRFSYHDPATVEEALGLLARHGDAARILAGGQSLMPMLEAAKRVAAAFELEKSAPSAR